MSISIFGLSPLKKNFDNDLLTITPLGGFGQIGMNCMLWTTPKTHVVVDCGLMFPSDFHLGIDVLIPQFDYILEDKENLSGIVLTHGHEDHIGALPWLVPYINAPIYGSEFTLALVEHKLREHGLLDRCELRVVTGEKPIQLGDMTFHFFPVCHSIIDGFALGVETPAGKVVHTGDFKIDPDPLQGPGTDLNQFSDFAGKEGVRLLLSDSTNVESEGYSRTEKEVLANLQDIFASTDQRMIVTLFSSHILRIQEVLDCAHATGRSVGISGRSLINNIEHGTRLGKLRIPDGLQLYTKNMPDLPDNQVVLLVTGSQGEPMSALSRIVSGEHRDFAIHQGDMVIQSSRLIPGNTVTVNTLINKLYRNGAELYDDKTKPVHASGHAQREELKAMFKATRPEFFVPVHGEYRHLVKHVQLAQECGVSKENCRIIENGHPFTLSSSGFTLEPEVLAGAVFVDGKGVGDVGHSVLRERHLLGGEGFVLVQMVIDEETGIVVYGPEISSKGFVFEEQYDYVLQDAICIILDCIEEGWNNDLEGLKDKIRQSLRRFFRRVLARDPIIVPGIIRI